MVNQQALIYVAGHRGMVGSAIVRRLKQLGFKSKKFDERKFAEKVSKNLKIKNFNSVLNANEVEKYMSRVLLSHDEPFTSIRILAQYKLYETFSNDSTVIFDASGGDEIGAGYQYYQWPWFLDLLQNKEKGAFDRFKKLIKNNSGKNLTNSIYGSVINHEQLGTTTADGTPYLNILNYFKYLRAWESFLDLFISNETLNNNSLHFWYS